MYYLNIVRFGKRNIRETYNGSASETRAYASRMLTKYKGEYVDVAFRPEGGKVIPQGFIIKLPSPSMHIVLLSFLKTAAPKAAGKP